MKNKKLLHILFVIFSILAINAVSSEEIIFETPEIEASNNGDILKAYKGGKAIINKEVAIIGDRFEYNRKNEILSVEGNVKINDSINNITTDAEKVIYFKKQEKLLSKGITKIKLENDHTINSKNITLLLDKNEISSNENTTVSDLENNFYNANKFRYLIKKKLFRGNEVVLTTSQGDEYLFKDAFINLETKEIHGKDFEANLTHSTFGNLNNEPRFKGNKVYSNDNITSISKGAFTTCKKRENKNCPPWLVEAKEVEHNKNKKIITYKNAWLKVYDVPVMYFPYFFHPDPSVKRQSGFLIPQIGDSQNLGSSAYIPYFYVLNDREDLTLKPRIFSDNKFSLQTEYRKVSKKISHIFDISYTDGHDSYENDKSDSRSHFFSNSIINIDSSTFDVSNIEIQLQKTSNNTYLKLFNLESPLFESGGTSSGVSTLNSFINFEAYNENLSFDTSIESYQKLNSSTDEQYEYLLPNYNFSRNITSPDYLNGSILFNSFGSQHIFDTNIKESKIINDLSYQSPNKFFSNGVKNNYNILIKNVNTDGQNSTKYKNALQSELLSSLVVKSSYPLLREGISFNNYLTPKIALRYSPNNMKNLKDEDRRVDINNIFSLNRISASDTVESGQSITIGTEYKKVRKNNSELPENLIELNLATVFRDSHEDNIPKSTYLGNKNSGLVGQLNFSPNNFFTGKYNFSADNNLDKLNYNELSAEFRVNNFLSSFKYIEEGGEIGSEHYLQNTTSYSLNENNSFSFSTRKNKKIDLTEFYDLVYQYKNDCLTAAIQYNKEYYSDTDMKPSEQLFFSLTIVPLGAYESKSILPN